MGKHSLKSISGRCDICGKGISQAYIVPAFDFKKAVRSGYLPDKSGFSGYKMNFAVFGLSGTQAENGWRQQALADSTDWAVCSNCYPGLENYL